MEIRLTAIVTCPACDARTEAAMPEDACQFFWDCPACGAVLRPKRAADGSAGDCCVFCSYADMPCPPVQRGARGGARPSCCS